MSNQFPLECSFQEAPSTAGASVLHQDGRHGPEWDSRQRGAPAASGSSFGANRNVPSSAFFF